MEVLMGALQQALVGVCAEARQECRVRALAVQADDPIWGAHYDAHACSVTGEVQHIQYLVHTLQHTCIPCQHFLSHMMRQKKTSHMLGSLRSQRTVAM